MSDDLELQPLTDVAAAPSETPTGLRVGHQAIRTFAVVVAAFALVVIAIAQVQAGRRESKGLCAQRVLYERSSGAPTTSSSAEDVQRKIAACFR